jgi:hypothetical protein
VQSWNLAPSSHVCIPATDTPRHRSHHDYGKEGGLLDQEEELSFVKLDQSTVRLRDGSCASGRVVDERHLSKEAIFAHGLYHRLTNHDIDFPFLHDIHEVAGLAVLKDDLARREVEWYGIFFENVW